MPLSARVLFPTSSDGPRTDRIRKRTIDSQDHVRRIVDHDQVADRVEIFHPLPFGVFDARKKPRIFQRDGSMSGQRLHQVPVRLGQLFRAIHQA